MPALIYIHGFLSSPQSYKASQMRTWLAVHHPEIAYYCPQLTPYPEDTRKTLERMVESLLPEPVYLMGSSLGGFWASWLVEKYNLRAVLINPAVRPHEFMPKYIGQSLKSYHSDDRYSLEPHHIDEIKAVDVKPLSINNYWLLVQTGDETLDYTQSVAKYAGCKQTIEQGGDHAFHGFERFFESAIAFFQEK